MRIVIIAYVATACVSSAAASGLTSAESISLSVACSRASSIGPAELRQCQNRHLADLETVRRPVGLERLDSSESISLSVACSRASSMGPAELRRCQSRHLAGLGISETATAFAPSKDSWPELGSSAEAPVTSRSRQQRNELSRADMRELQTLLREAGHDPGPIDGIYGQSTRSAIESFERAAGREPSGRATSLLLAEMGGLVRGLRFAESERRREASTTPAADALSSSSGPTHDTQADYLDASRPNSPASAMEIYARSKNAVWMVVAGQSVEAFEQMAGLSQGSAVAVGERTLLTNCHVTSGNEIIFIGQGDLVDLAHIIYGDAENDRCVLRPKELRLDSIVRIRSYRDLQVGERVFAIGNPSGLAHSLSEGLISALREHDGMPLIQTTAAISSGSSGGGLFDGEGNLIGITTFLLEGGQSLNFAIAADSYALR